MNANFDGADINVQQFRNFVVSKFLVPCEHQQFTLIRRQLKQRLMQSFAFLFALEFLVRKRTAGGNIKIGLERSLRRMLPKEIRSRIAGDLEHPGVEVAVVAKSPAVFQDSEKHVLNQILRDRAISGKPAKEAEKFLVMSVKKQTELANVSIPHGEHQPFVCVLHWVRPGVNDRNLRKRLHIGYNDPA